MDIDIDIDHLLMNSQRESGVFFKHTDAVHAVKRIFALHQCLAKRIATLNEGARHQVARAATCKVHSVATRKTYLVQIEPRNLEVRVVNVL